MTESPAPAFIPGLALCRRFYWEAVRPILTAPMPESMRPFWGRPFQVMALHGFADALLAEIRDPAVQRIAARPPIGGIDLFSDNTDLIENPLWQPALRRLYA